MIDVTFDKTVDYGEKDYIKMPSHWNILVKQQKNVERVSIAMSNQSDKN